MSRIEQRIQEADRLGFDTIYIAQSNMKNVKREGLGIDVRAVSRVEDLLYEVFG